MIERFAQILLAELDMSPHPVQPLIVESVSTALAAHLLRSYYAFEAVECQRGGSLGKLELVRLTAFIEDNLDLSFSRLDPLSLRPS